MSKEPLPRHYTFTIYPYLPLSHLYLCPDKGKVVPRGMSVHTCNRHGCSSQICRYTMRGPLIPRIVLRLLSDRIILYCYIAVWCTGLPTQANQPPPCFIIVFTVRLIFCPHLVSVYLSVRKYIYSICFVFARVFLLEDINSA